MSADDLVKAGQITTQVGIWIMGITGGISGLVLVSNMRENDNFLTKLYLSSAMTGIGIGLAVTGVGNAISTRASRINSELTTREALDVTGRILLGVGLPMFALSNYLEGYKQSLLLGGSVFVLTAGSVSLGISQNVNL